MLPGVKSSKVDVAQVSNPGHFEVAPALMARPTQYKLYKPILQATKRHNQMKAVTVYHNNGPTCECSTGQ